MRNTFTEFLNRIDDIIVFLTGSRTYTRYRKVQLQGLKKLLSNKQIEVEFSEQAIDWLGEHGYDPDYGARPLKRLIQRELQNASDKIARRIGCSRER